MATTRTEAASQRREAAATWDLRELISLDPTDRFYICIAILCRFERCSQTDSLRWAHHCIENPCRGRWTDQPRAGRSLVQERRAC